VESVLVEIMQREDSLTSIIIHLQFSVASAYRLKNMQETTVRKFVP